MKHQLTALLIGATALPALSASTLAQWDFNSDDGQVSTGSLLPATGAGSLALVGGATQSFTSGSPADPAGFPLDSAWSVGGFPAQGTASGTVGLQGFVSTVGHGQVTVSFDYRTQPSGNKWFLTQATTDHGTTWSDVATFAVAAADQWFTTSFDVSAALATAADQAGFGFRVVAVFQPGTSAYQAAEAGYNGDFGLVIDRLAVRASPVSEGSPVVLALAGIGLVVSLRTRRARR